MTLPPRQLEVLKLVVAGYTIKEIASQLNLSANTIANQREIVYEKCRVRNSIALVRFALVNNMVTMPEFTASQVGNITRWGV